MFNEEMSKENNVTIQSQLREMSVEELKQAIKEHPHWIGKLDKQTEDLCMIAVQENPKTLCLVRKQNAYICELAIKKEPWVICMVRNLTEHEVKVAIEAAKDLSYRVQEYLPEELYEKYK